MRTEEYIPGKPIWEYGKAYFKKHQRESKDEYERNILLRDFLAAVKQRKPDKDLVLKLAKAVVAAGFAEPDDCPDWPRSQPRNRDEADAEMRRAEKHSVLSRA